MEEVHHDLVRRILATAVQKHPFRILVGIAGPPGCGKSTIASRLAQILDSSHADGLDSPLGSSLGSEASASRRSHESQAFRTCVVGMDGFHYPRAVLDKFPDPVEAHVRRGAPLTFDVDAMLAFITKLRESASLLEADRPMILAPSFDHAIKDPIMDSIQVPPQADIVILEGNYLLLDEQKWNGISDMLDLRIFVDVDPEIARNRVALRHVQAGIEPKLEDGLRRFDTNDKLNGDLVRQRLVETCDVKVVSVSV